MILVDNKLQVAKYRLAFVVTFVIGLFFLFFALFSKSQITENLVYLIIGLVLLAVFLFMVLLKPEYVYLSIEKNSKIVVRNYTAFPVFRKYKAFEIPLKAIHDFEINKTFFGLRRFIRFTVKTQKQIGKYPWLSLSAAPKKDILKIIEALNKMVPTDKRKKADF